MRIVRTDRQQMFEQNLDRMLSFAVANAGGRSFGWGQRSARRSGFGIGRAWGKPNGSRLLASKRFDPFDWSPPFPYLCRRYSGATLRELSIELGLSHPDGSANLVRRAKARLKDSAELRKQCEQIERKLGLKTEDQV